MYCILKSVVVNYVLSRQFDYWNYLRTTSVQSTEFVNRKAKVSQDRKYISAEYEHEIKLKIFHSTFCDIASQVHSVYGEQGVNMSIFGQ